MQCKNGKANSVNFEKKRNFLNRIKHADHKNFCIQTDVFKYYKGENYDEIYEALSKLKKKKLKITISYSKNIKIRKKNLILNRIIFQEQLNVYIK